MTVDLPPDATGPSRSGASLPGHHRTPEDATLTVAAVSRLLGVAPATLRTWDRRYGLGPSAHHAGAHRRYTAEDLDRLLHMRRLTLEGVAPGEAARLALAAPAGTPTEADIRDAYADALPAVPDPAALARAAGAFDHAALRWQLARVHPRDTLAWWDELVAPALAQLRTGIRLEQPGECATSTLTATAFAELRSRTALAEERVTQDPAAVVLIVPLPEGAPDLAVHALAAALTAERIAARLISGGLPEDVAAVADGVAARLVLLHVGPGKAETRRANALVAHLVEHSPARPVYVLRESLDHVERPSLAVHRVRSNVGALHEVLALTR